MKQVKFEDYCIYELSGRQLIEYYDFINELGELNPSKSLELACLLISMSVKDKDGNPVFTKESAKDLSFTDITKLSSKVIEVSGMGETKNLKNSRKDSSTTS